MIDLFNPEVSKVVEGVVGKKILIYGAAGTGKTSNAVKAPKPLVLCFENGLSAIQGVPNIKIKKWVEFRDVVKQLTDPTKVDELRKLYETIIIDSCDGIELLAQTYICGVYGAPSVAKGNEGYGLWKEYAQEVQRQLSLLDNSGFTIIFLDHSGTRDFYDPTGQKYAKIYPAGDKRSIDPIINMCDIVAFAQFDNQIDSSNPVVLSTLYLRGNSAYEAKTRFDYMPTAITAWNYDKLTKAINDSIKEGNLITISAEEAQKELDVTKAAERASTLPLKEEISRIANMLTRMKQSTGSLKEYEEILRNKVGNPQFKCNTATEEQREALDIVYNALKELGYSDDIVIAK